MLAYVYQLTARCQQTHLCLAEGSAEHLGQPRPCVASRARVDEDYEGRLRHSSSRVPRACQVGARHPAVDDTG